MKLSRLLPIIGIALFIYLLLQVDVRQVIASILSANPLLFGVALLLTAVNIMLKAFKWQLLFNTYSISVPYSRFLKSWVVGLSLSMVTPGKVGDFAKACYLKDKAPLGKSLTTVMADRIIDLITLFVLALVGLGFFAIAYSPNNILLTTAVALFTLFLITVALFSKKRIATYILRPLHHRLLPAKHRERTRSLYNDFYAGISIIMNKKGTVALVTLLTFIVWGGTIFVIYFIDIALGLVIPLEFLLVVFPIISLLEALPISFSGVGTRDAAMIFFFSFLAIPAASSVSVSLLYLLTGYVFVAIGFAIWYRNPIHIRGV